ncbi:hypothetical protein CH339_10240 [Rhodobium orientis]|uniref:O-antigen ligase-related domain-containing protein n=1 Tax=Rhodobium orientis TaxID=34017 RepID=A0A327JLW0_9HYPH|nr:hypothetical protein [Rhodobium orientis]RAI27460.1 hypothetical protein CH339_10240 [Rhodobium orientis]
MFNGILWFAVFLGGFVINEPAPYDLMLAATIVVWLVIGFRVQRGYAPLVVLMAFYMAGGVMSLTQLEVIDSTVVMYMAVSGFLAGTSIFFASIITTDPSRLNVIRNAYLAAAVFAAVAGIAGYFHLFPGAGIFTLYDRAKGTFQDPNVYGPFLVLAATFLIHDILSRPLENTLPRMAALMAIVLAVFLSFSRASWGLAFFAAVMTALLVFINETDPVKRLRLIMLAAVAAGVVTLLLLAALSSDAVHKLFEARAKLVQDYDGARLGRFARHWIGFQMATHHPFGIGPLEFGKLFAEDPHNVYLKGFLAYGWLGGFSYIALTLLTLGKLAPINFKPRPWRAYAQCVSVVLLGHALMGIVIDMDHWRHMYLLFGVAWGIIATDALHTARQRQPHAAAYSPPQPSSASRA